MNIFLAINCLFMFMMFIIWNRKDVVNVAVKTTFFSLGVTSALFLLSNLGYIVHTGLQ